MYQRREHKQKTPLLKELRKLQSMLQRR
ncbi:hypothetical protein NC652_015821 [Populus alba x Populus x berolinensis]|nr:hypothetical protein NC652_015821 [Populus alba x Populus x berolinensis]